MQQRDETAVMRDETRVLYNETCPVCRFEIDSYAKQARAANLPIRFETLGQAAVWGLTPDLAARRLHVISQGKLLSGVPAFQALWQAMPRWHWLARLTALPIVQPLAFAVYDHVLAPVLYRAHLRRQSKRG